MTDNEIADGAVGVTRSDAQRVAAAVVKLVASLDWQAPMMSDSDPCLVLASAQGVLEGLASYQSDISVDYACARLDALALPLAAVVSGERVAEQLEGA